MTFIGYKGEDLAHPDCDPFRIENYANKHEPATDDWWDDEDTGAEVKVK